MGVTKMYSLRSIQSCLTGTLIYWWIIGFGCAGAAVYCPYPGHQDGGNTTSLAADGQTTVRLISCTRGCCPGSADGCCYRTTDDVVVYSVPISVCTVLCVITIGLVYRHVRTKRLIRENQARLQASMDKPAESPLSLDNPPSYSSCMVETVSSTTNLTVHDVDDVIEVVIHATAKDVEDDLPMSPPPVYDDVFRSGDDDQVAVISPGGHVCFVDHNLLPPSVCCHGGRDGCARPGWHSPRLCHVTANEAHTAENCHNYCPSPIRSPRLAHLKETEVHDASPGSTRSLRLCHGTVTEDNGIDDCHTSIPSSGRSLRLCHVKVTEDQGIDNCHTSIPSSGRSFRLCHVKENNDHGSEEDYKIRLSAQSKDHVPHASCGEDHVTEPFNHASYLTGIGDHMGPNSSNDTREGDGIKVVCSDNDTCLMTSGEDDQSVGVTNEACTDISCGR